MLVKWDAKQTSILVALNKYWFLHRGRYGVKILSSGGLK
jgi:hypothetical protein